MENMLASLFSFRTDFKFVAKQDSLKSCLYETEYVAFSLFVPLKPTNIPSKFPCDSEQVCQIT